MQDLEKMRKRMGEEGNRWLHDERTRAQARTTFDEVNPPLWAKRFTDLQISRSTVLKDLLWCVRYVEASYFNTDQLALKSVTMTVRFALHCKDCYGFNN